MTVSLKSALMASCLSLAIIACSPAETKTPTSSNTASAQALPKMTDAKSYGDAAAEWQLNTISDLSYLPNRIPQSSYNRGWVKGAFYIGLERGEKGAEGTCQTRWCWADAIFMAPPAWAAVSNVTGDDNGTAFFGFGLAWGINQGILKDDKYVQARDEAWAAMKDAVQPNGMVGWIQQIGKDPQ